MAADTLTNGFALITQPLPERKDTSLLVEEEDDREITAITALEIETSKAKETIAKLRDSNIIRKNRETPKVGSLRQAVTPAPIEIVNGLSYTSPWNSRAIYNNSVFDIGMALTLSKDSTLLLTDAVEEIVQNIEGVIKVNLTLIEGGLEITANSSRYRVLEEHGQVVTFSKYFTDFDTIQLTALQHKTRVLIITWRLEE